MKHTTLKITGLALAFAAAAFTARADIALNENVSLYGYAAASVQFEKPNKGNSTTTMDMDAAKLGFALNFAPVTAKLSFFTDAGAGNLYILEANLTYDLGQGLSVTGGRFQSWIGYEPFDIPNGNFITNAFAMAPLFGAGIPNFHEGVRVDYALDKAQSVGVAVVNSVYPGFGKYRGDGRLSNGYGVEVHYGFKDGALSAGVTAAYQNNRGANVGDVLNYALSELGSIASSVMGGGTLSLPVYRFAKSNVYVGNVWAEYAVNSKTTVGAEIFYSNAKLKDPFSLDALLGGLFDVGGMEVDLKKSEVFHGLVMVKHRFDDKFSLAGRISAGQEKLKMVAGSSKAMFWKVSVQPGYVITKNLSAGFEVNYAAFNNDARALGKAKNVIFVGAQAVFKF